MEEHKVKDKGGQVNKFVTELFYTEPWINKESKDTQTDEVVVLTSIDQDKVQAMMKNITDQTKRAQAAHIEMSNSLQHSLSTC